MTVTIAALATNSVGGDPYIYSLNNAGTAVGTEGGIATLWQDGKVTALFGLFSASSINDLGQIVGFNVDYASLRSTAVLYQNNTVMVLPTLGGTTTGQGEVALYQDSTVTVTPSLGVVTIGPGEAAIGINNLGQVVGSSVAPGGQVEACLWQSGQATGLGILAGGSESRAFDINGSSQIVGYSGVSGGLYHAFLWQEGVMTDLGALAFGEDSYATAINVNGEVVGYDTNPYGVSRAVLWQNGKMTDLGTLPDEASSKAEGINASGIIVGQAWTTPGAGGNHAVMWENGKIYDLNNLISPTSGWFLQSADAINDNDEIVGHGTFANSSGDGTFELIFSGNAAVIGATVQTALQSTTTTPVAIVDSSANVLGNLGALEVLWQKNLLTAITLSDAVSPAWTLTAAQFDKYADVVSDLESPIELTVTGAVEASQAGKMYSSEAVTQLVVTDTRQNIIDNFDALAAAAAAGKIEAIIASDDSFFQISVYQYLNGGAAIARLGGEYKLEINDYSNNISAALDQLQALAISGKITDIDIYTTSYTANIELTSDQLANDQAALNIVVRDILSLSVTPSSASASIDGAGYGTTVVLPGASTAYVITSAGNGAGFTLSGGGVDDKISNITALGFSDHTLIIGSQIPQVPDGVSSFQVAALYAAVLDREPDIAGLAFYERVAASTQYSITTYAEWFLESPEYELNPSHNYAIDATGDAQFIADTYQNLLKRSPESGAVNYYETKVIAPILGSLAPGTAAYAEADHLAHATVLTYFSQSPEFKSDVAVTAQTPADGQHWLMLI